MPVRCGATSFGTQCLSYSDYSHPSRRCNFGSHSVWLAVFILPLLLLVPCAVASKYSDPSRLVVCELKLPLVKFLCMYRRVHDASERTMDGGRCTMTNRRIKCIAFVVYKTYTNRWSYNRYTNTSELMKYYYGLWGGGEGRGTPSSHQTLCCVCGGVVQMLCGQDIVRCREIQFSVWIIARAVRHRVVCTLCNILNKLVRNLSEKCMTSV